MFLNGQEEILRAGFAHHRVALGTSTPQRFNRRFAGHMHHVQRAAGQSRHDHRAVGGFAFDFRGTRQRMIRSGSVLPAASSAGVSCRFDITIFGMNHDDHAMIGGHAHGVEQRGVVDHEYIFIGHEQFQTGDTLIHHAKGISSMTSSRKSRHRHVKAIIDLGDAFGLLAPCLQAIMQLPPMG